MSKSEELVRVQFAVFSTKQEALDAGYPDAEEGTWQEKPSSSVLIDGWIALDHQ